jgi:DNA-binding MarR family transcriptional regulator
MTDVGTDRDAARIAWSAMCDLVLDNRRRQQVSEAVGLPFGRLRALRRVAPAPMTMGELAAAIGVDAPNCTPVVDDLEARGLVERRPHPTDRRSKMVAATPEGVRIATRADRIMGRPPPGLDALSPTELDLLAQILTKASARGDGAEPPPI